MAFEALTAEYGERFAAGFRGDLGASVYDWKCRLLEFAEPYDDGVLSAAFDGICQHCPDYPPSLRLIQAEMKRVHLELLKADRDAETLRQAREPVCAEGMQRMAGMMQGLSASLRAAEHKGNAPKTVTERLDPCIEYECAVWAHSSDKQMPHTHAIAQQAAWEEGQGRLPSVLAAEAALRVGGETLAMFRQIVEYQREGR